MRKKSRGVERDKRLTVTVDIAEHRGRDVDRKDVVGIGEETDTGNQTDLHVEPAILSGTLLARISADQAKLVIQ